MTPECAVCHKSGEGIILIDFPAYQICEECMEDDVDQLIQSISKWGDD